MGFLFYKKKGEFNFVFTYCVILALDKTMELTKELFGEYGGQAIDLYSLENKNGVVVKIMNFGATITSITIPEGDKRLELACGFDAFEGYFAKEYKENAPYFGATVGRYCSQIKDAQFTLDGETYYLAKIVGENNLHGGKVGFDKQVWTVAESSDALKMTLTSPDGDEGFPGEVLASVSFVLTDDNEIKISYSATTTKATPLSMTNHTYFNLSGFKSSVESFVAQVNTDKLMAMDDTGAATGEILDVTGTDHDLRQGQVIGDLHKSVGGLESFYAFDNNFALTKLAKITDPESGRSLTVSSSEPCMLLYTGKYTSDDLRRESGEQYGQYRGFCCETHRWQNGPNIPESPKTVTKEGEEFASETIFKLTF